MLTLFQAEESYPAPASQAPLAPPRLDLVGKRPAVERAFRYLLPRHPDPGMHVEKKAIKRIKINLVFLEKQKKEVRNCFLLFFRLTRSREIKALRRKL